MKKAMFIPILAIFTIIIVGVVGLMFYENKLKEKTEMLGEKPGMIIKTILDNEKDSFFVQDSARISYCNALTELSQNTGLPEKCISNYPIWDFGFGECNPDEGNTKNNLEERFTNLFKKYLDEYLKYNENTKEIKYDIKLSETGFSLITEPKQIENNDEDIGILIKYDFKVDLNQEIKSNIKEFKELIQKASDYRNCIDSKKSVEACNKETKLNGIKSDNLINFEVSSIKNPCTLQDINIRFALKA